MSVAVVLVVLAAAVLHATWNAMAHALDDPFVGFTLMGIVYTAGAALLVLTSPVPALGSWPFLLTSVTLQVAYMLLLIQCYRWGDFGQVYPLSRGSAPWLVAIAAAVFAGETLAPTQLVGIGIVSAGLVCLVFAGGWPGRAELPVVAAALLTGVTIAAYTTIDGLGVRRAGTVTGYLGWSFLLEGPVLPIAALAVRGRRLWAQARPHLAAGLTGGALSLTAYGLVLWAQSRGALAPIAALRESSIILGAIIGAVVFHERFGRWRIIAAVLVASGVVVISV